MKKSLVLVAMIAMALAACGKKEEVKDQLHDVAAGDELSNEDLSKAMAAYTAAISKTKDMKIS